MTLRERTRQQLDPVGTFSNRITTVGAAVAAFVLAALMTGMSLDQTKNPAMAILALVVLATSSVIVVMASDPYRGPFTRNMHFAAVIYALMAATISTGATWGTDLFIHYAWAPTSLGMLFLAMAAFRPAREIVSTGALAAVYIGFLAMLQSSSIDLDIPVLAIVGVVVMPLLALNFGSAAFSLSTVLALESWQRRATRAVDELSNEREAGIARSVQQDRVTILNREVLPFFTELLLAETISDEDRRHARAIADSIRRVMVAEVDRTWLENLIEHLRSRVRREGGARNNRVVFDDDHVANLMTYDQRTGLRAFIVALYDQADNRPRDLEIVLARSDGLCHAIVSVRGDLLDGIVKTRFGPYIAVLRAVFRNLHVEYLQSVLTLRFSYEQR